MTQRYCSTLDLRDDPQLIAEYKRYHQKVWPEITARLKGSGIEDAEIYLLVFVRGKGKGRPGGSYRAGLGSTNVEVPAATAASQAGREVAAHGKNFQTRNVSAT